MTEQEIIAGCKALDRKAQKALVDNYSHYLYGICVRYAMDRAFAKDCLQESLIRIIQKIDTYQEKGKFKSWISQVTAMKCLELMRKEKRYCTDEVTEYSDSYHEQEVFSQMRLEEVTRFLNGLSDNYRIALNMFLIEGYNHKEISTILNITEGSSRSLIARGRQMIQEAFKDEGSTIQNIVTNTSPLRQVE